MTSAYPVVSARVVPLADRAIGNLQQRLIGTYHGVSRDQLQAYLHEFVFRHNPAETTYGWAPDPGSALESGTAAHLMSRSAALRISPGHRAG